MDSGPLTWKYQLDGCTVGQLIDLLREVAEELDNRGLPECSGYVESAADRLWTRYAGIPRPAATESPQDQRSAGGALSPHPWERQK